MTSAPQCTTLFANVLGTGATSVVQEGRMGDVPVAIKIVVGWKKHKDSTADDVRMAIHERRFHEMHGKHTNIVPLLHTEIVSDRPLWCSVGMVFPLARGTLRDVCPLADAAAVELVRILLDVILHLARCGCIHGDIKPDNVLVFGPPGARLCDAIRVSDFSHWRVLGSACRPSAIATATYRPVDLFCAGEMRVAATPDIDVWAAVCTAACAALNGPFVRVQKTTADYIAEIRRRAIPRTVLEPFPMLHALAGKVLHERVADRMTPTDLSDFIAALQASDPPEPPTEEEAVPGCPGESRKRRHIEPEPPAEDAASDCHGDGESRKRRYVEPESPAEEEDAATGLRRV